MNEKILLAVSGGVDSIVLAHLFHSLEIPFEIAHVNYGLRGKESDGDEKFVKDFASKLEIRFHVKKCMKKEITKKDSNLQEKARDLRYTFFNEIAGKERIRHIATAHQQDDNIETVLLNFIRGTGIRGLTGMRTKSGKIIRPLLNYSRNDILAYAKKNKLKWREDSSNQEDKYTRNIIRNRFLGELSKHVPQGRKGMISSMRRLNESEQLITLAMNQWVNDKISTANGMQLISLKSITDKAGMTFFSQWLRKLGFNGSQAGMVKDNVISGRSSFTITTKNHFINRDRDNFWIGSREQTKAKPQLIIELSSFPTRSDLVPTCAFVDADRLGNISHRNWQSGDSMTPYGMKGRKKVSDILNELKLPAHEKKELFVVLSGDELVWIPGYRIADKFRITPETKRVMKISFK
ncbi:MAG: tRNA lysidine(34) synthetase TilS [Bacteroidetes bacterium]|nr:tRNA lysidine(34) synthetase TilS [Bacteroidota bacterium]